MSSQPPDDYNPQYPQARRSDVYPAYQQPYAWKSDQPSYHPPPQPESSGAMEDTSAAFLAQEQVNRRFATAGQLYGYSTGLPFLLAIIFGKSLIALAVGALLGLPIAVVAIALSVKGLRSFDKKTAKQGLFYSILTGVLLLLVGLGIILFLPFK